MLIFIATTAPTTTTTEQGSTLTTPPSTTPPECIDGEELPIDECHHFVCVHNVFVPIHYCDKTCGDGETLVETTPDACCKCLPGNLCIGILANMAIKRQLHENKADLRTEMADLFY